MIDRLRRAAPLLLAPLVLGLAAGCGTNGGGAATSSPTWATVSGHSISKADVMRRIHVIQVLDPQVAPQLTQRSTVVSITQELASEYLLQQQMQQAKYKPSQKDISSSQSSLVSSLQSNYGGSSGLTKELKKAGVTQKDIDAYVASGVAMQGFLNQKVTVPKVTSSEVSTYYKQNLSLFKQPEEYDLRHILVKTQPLAQQILQKLKDGGSFSALAKQYSTDKPSAANGGDLGYQPLSSYVQPFAAAAQKLTKKGQLSGVVQSQYGYHIIQLVGIKAATTLPLSQVSSEIQGYLQQQNQQTADTKYINALRAKAKIVLHVPQKLS